MLTVVILNEIYHIPATPLNIDKDIVYTLTLLIIMKKTLLFSFYVMHNLSFLFYFMKPYIQNVLKFNLLQINLDHLNYISNKTSFHIGRRF